MKTKAKRYQAILDRAISLEKRNRTETFLDVGEWLNKRGFLNNAGQPYALNSRGIAKVISSAWAYCKKEFGEETALPIANSFTKSSGEYAWSE